MMENKRESKFELMRIIMMILIIAHHYVVNSGIERFYNFSNITPNMIFLQIIGFSGKIMINCFILITGYFMIEKKISSKKIIRLFLQIKFYQIAVYIILYAIGFEKLNFKRIIEVLFNITYYVNVYFSETFFLLYILIPFVNILINSLNKKQNSALLIISLFYFTIISTFSLRNNTFNEISWYILVYMIGAYIRLYPSKYDKSKKIWISATIISVICSIGSIISIDLINNKLNMSLNPYFFVTNAHKLLAVTTSISMFMLFKNINIKYNSFINKIATATFGVLLIHSNSDAMRDFLWNGVFKVKEQYFSDNLFTHAILTIIIVYVVCVCIELFRIKFIEKPFFSRLEKSNMFIKMDNYIENVCYINGKEEKEENHV